MCVQRSGFALAMKLKVQLQISQVSLKVNLKSLLKKKDQVRHTTASTNDSRVSVFFIDLCEFFSGFSINCSRKSENHDAIWKIRDGIFDAISCIWSTSSKNETESCGKTSIKLQKLS